jgi:Sulfotransferase domain
MEEQLPVRIVVVSPPRSGNHWVECMLSTIYDLKHLAGKQKPAVITRKAVRAWVEAGGFPDQSITHMHRGFDCKFCDVIEAIPAHLVTVVRDPYDVFVSRYYWTQRPTLGNRSGNSRKAKRRPWQSMVGQSLDDPAVLAFLAAPKGFGSSIGSTNKWLHSGRAIAVRYEDLHDDPVAALTRVTKQIAPVERRRIEAAIEACQAENMRQKSAAMASNVRVAKVGDSREHLTEAHLAIFRERYADLIRSLGYEVR